MPDMSQLEMGACAVKVAGTDVGHTSGPVTLTVKPIWRPRRDEKYGESAVDYVLLGSRVEVTARFQEKTLANLKRALPHGLDGATYLGEGRTPGFKLSTAAAEVTLHPLELDGEDATKDVVLRRAAAYGPAEIAFQEGEERSFEVVFVGLVDGSQDDGELHARLNQP